MELVIIIICNPSDLDMYEIRAIKMYRTVRPFGYNIQGGGQAVAGSTGAAQKRRRPEGEGLPKYISYRHGLPGNQGYSAQLPNGTNRVITSSRKTMPEKLGMITAWLEKALAGPVEKAPRTRIKSINDSLPPGMYYRSLPNGREGYDVLVGAKKKQFANKGFTLQEKFQLAIAYREKVMLELSGVAIT